MYKIIKNSRLIGSGPILNLTGSWAGPNQADLHDTNFRSRTGQAGLTGHWVDLPALLMS